MEDGRGPGNVPDRWLLCPRKANALLASKFLAFKTPLDKRYDPQIPAEHRFYPVMLFSVMDSYKVQFRNPEVLHNDIGKYSLCHMTSIIDNFFFFFFQVKLGLWIDLTYTSRFYRKDDVESRGAKYVKVQCRGHGETPSVEQTKAFVDICDKFIRTNPLESIGKYCR